MNIIGLMWLKNEADIIRETIEKALPHLDSLMIADDGSTDNSWDIVQDLKKEYSKIEHIQRNPSFSDKGQRNQLLNKVRERYPAEETWVQIIEADIIILDSNVRQIISSSKKIGVSWQTLNAVRKAGTWSEVDTYPNWKIPITQLMPWAHRLEVMLYSFRLMPNLSYNPNTWRPWPQGFKMYTNSAIKVDDRQENSPLLLHVGYRGPTHFYNKYKSMGLYHRRYPDWILESPSSVERTVPFFNGNWNKNVFEASRAGWQTWLRNKKGIYANTECRFFS